MQRVIHIKNGVVTKTSVVSVNETTAFASQVDFSLNDPFEKFKEGDLFDAERFLACYPNMAHPFNAPSDALTIFSPTPAFNRAVFVATGLQINPHAHIKSPYVYAVRDNAATFTALKAYGAFHNVRVPDYRIADKAQNTQLFAGAGFTTLLTTPVRTCVDIEAMTVDRIILKPSAMCGTTGGSYSTRSALYRIFTKAEALAALTTCGAFDDVNMLINEPIIAQQTADGEGDNFDALILSGGVNGAGVVWHFPPLILATQFNETGRNVQSTWSPENDSDETQQLQRKVETLIAGNTNCFYQLQFLRSNGVWVPHDFQYRMTYYVDFGLEQTGYQQHKADILKFVFDRSTNTPPLPASFALSGVQPRDQSIKKQFAAGQSKAAAVAALEAL